MTNEEIQAQFTSTLRAIKDTLDYLECRWQDEREYEDFAEYQKVLKTKIEEQGYAFVKATKRPFGVVAKSSTGHEVHFFAKANGFGWKAKSPR